MKRQTVPLDSPDVRGRIILAGIRLLARGGQEELTTRAVAKAAGVQGPTIYRLFGDKRGLLFAVAEYALSQFVAKKRALQPLADAIEDLRVGWDLSVEFGLANPALYSIINAHVEGGGVSPVAAAGIAMLRLKILRVAQAGHLCVTEEHALDIVRVLGTGTVMTLLSKPKEERDLALSHATRELAIKTITTRKAIVKQPGTLNAAITLRASLPNTGVLTAGEKLLFAELLDRLAAAP